MKEVQKQLDKLQAPMVIMMLIKEKVVKIHK